MKLFQGKTFIALLFTFLGIIISPYFFGNASDSSLYLQADPKKEISPARGQAISLETAFQEVFDSVSPSVVSIATEKTVRIKNHPFVDPFFDPFGGRGGGGEFKQKQNGLGSGVILNDEGYILTNEHVIADMDKLTVRLKNKKTYEAKVIGSDPIMDLALLKIKPTPDLIPASLGDSSRVHVGSWAIAIGAPLGFEQSFTVGVVSAVARGGIDSSGLGYLQTDAAINQGNSGGPLLNINGEVIGINRMIASQSGGSVGIGFAIPINDAKRIVEELKANGKVRRPWIGVNLSKITEEEIKEFKLKETRGALIRQIMDNSPAAASGLLVGDVITRVGEKDVETPEDVITYVREQKIGKKIDLRVSRKGSSLNLGITTAERPERF